MPSKAVVMNEVTQRESRERREGSQGSNSEEFHPAEVGCTRKILEIRKLRRRSQRWRRKPRRKQYMDREMSMSIKGKWSVVENPADMSPKMRSEKWV